jgi:hypothetical protein
MDEQTKYIVASNLTVAWFMANAHDLPDNSRMDDGIIAKFREYVSKIDSDDSGFVGVMPEVGHAR